MGGEKESGNEGEGQIKERGLGIALESIRGEKDASAKVPAQDHVVKGGTTNLETP
jgi:hypothetical protein